MFLKKLIYLSIFLVAAQCASGQHKNKVPESTGHEAMIRKIYDDALLKGKGYEHLRYLCKRIGGRLAGSPQAAAAVEWTRQVMDSMGLDTVYLQPVMVPHWIRGEKEKGLIVSMLGAQEIPVVALGNSVGTGAAGVTAEIIEVKQLSELATLGKEKIQGRIVFFNRPMNATHFDTFKAYGEAGDQRRQGPSEAAKYGAVAVIIRSLASNPDDFPHTGSTAYQLNVPQIPAAALSTNGADLLSRRLKEEPGLKFHLQTNCIMLPEVQSYNVVGEIRGTEKPEEIISVGGHLDSWELGEGAHDDGAGCMQSIEVLRILKSINYKPKRTIRAVMFMNEENGLRGGKQYAKVAGTRGEKHIAAIESDRGGFTPREFQVDATPEKLQGIAGWAELFKPYGISQVTTGHGGADISPLKDLGTVLIGYAPDSQRYFDLHHTSEDTFEKVSKRELELGAAAMAAMTYLLSEYGVK